ncbi:Amino acid permease 8, partial [Linum perenne]
TGTVWTASAHIITTIIGSGVLSLAWGIAQLGWIAGPATLLIFSSITYYTSRLLADCYRHHSTGKRNYTYMEAVNAYLGQRMETACGVVQCVMLCGATIGYAITASISMVAIRKSGCLHEKGRENAASCKYSTNPYLIGMGILEVVVSQIPNFHKLAWLSVVAAVMSFLYASIGLGLAVSRVASEGETSGSMTGVETNGMDKVWRMFTAFGDMAFACSYSAILIEIQSSSSSSTSEKNVMKKASGIAVTVSTVFYLLCGCFGYAAFGDAAPGNMLSASGFYEPFWLIDVANVCIIIHLVGAFQVTAQPVFTRLEAWATNKWPESEFVNREYPKRRPRPAANLTVNPMRLVGRTALVAAATVVAMAVPFFNDVLALLGAISYWPLTVYFPVEMHIAQSKMIRKSSGRPADASAGAKWVVLQLLNVFCLVVAVAAACGAIHGLSRSLLDYKPFMFKQ